MKIPFVESHNFFFDFFEKNQIPAFYSKINGVPKSFFAETVLSKKARNKVHIVNCVPPHIFDDGDSIDPSYGFFSKSYRIGFAMDLTNHDSARAYLRDRLGKKTFKNIRQDQQRLERDHNIRVETYHGDIDRSLCTELLNTLKKYVESRFEGRTHKHTALSRWDFYAETTYKNICAKRASLFVVYNNNDPIAISLSYHYKNIFNATITSFDQEYYRYSLGKLMFVWQLEWCYENGYGLLDTGWGNLDYKIKFCNAVYYYKTHVFYQKKSFFKKILAYTISWLLLKKHHLITLRGKKIQDLESAYEGLWLKPERFKC